MRIATRPKEIYDAKGENGVLRVPLKTRFKLVLQFSKILVNLALVEQKNTSVCFCQALALLLAVALALLSAVVKKGGAYLFLTA